MNDRGAFTIVLCRVMISDRISFDCSDTVPALYGEELVLQLSLPQRQADEHLCRFDPHAGLNLERGPGSLIILLRSRQHFGKDVDLAGKERLFTYKKRGLSQ